MDIETKNLKFMAGDVVQFKSGGVLMTVFDQDERGVRCSWNVSGEIESETIPAAMLKYVPLQMDKQAKNTMGDYPLDHL